MELYSLDSTPQQQLDRCSTGRARVDIEGQVEVHGQFCESLENLPLDLPVLWLLHFPVVEPDFPNGDQVLGVSSNPLRQRFCLFQIENRGEESCRRPNNPRIVTRQSQVGACILQRLDL